jgi:predicted nucleic acid-binding protein
LSVTHLLDTSAYSQPLRKRALASVQRRWEALGDARVCTSIICEAEVLVGLEMKASERLWKAYAEILQGRLALLDVDIAVARVYAALAAQTARTGRPRAPFDLLIAATAKAHGLVVATCNAKHFAGLEGIAVEDWLT